jgi:hypothetical protein
MNIGSQPAFAQPPVWNERDQTWDSGASGMTYRQWLIGMIASGDAAAPEWQDADWIIRRADAIIAELNAEKPCE